MDKKQAPNNKRKQMPVALRATQEAAEYGIELMRLHEEAIQQMQQ